MSQGYERALELLRATVTPKGFLASTESTANYRRIWARDGVVCGLAGLQSGDEELIEGFAATLRTLAAHQGQHGEIPSNVRMDASGEVDRVSYGGSVGRVDSVPWFVIGVCSYSGRTGDPSLAEELAPRVERALELLSVWEFNGRGLVYVPLSGTWADEYPQHGYLLHVQVLRHWALAGWARLFGDPSLGRAAEALAERLRVNYWPEPESLGSALVHSPRVFERHLERGATSRYFSAGFNPSGYYSRFDAWSNALCVLLALPNSARQAALLGYGEELQSVGPTGLVPCFWPPIGRDDPEWPALRAAAVYDFKNESGGYHNGGAWPMINGWWGMALVSAGRVEEARELLERIDEVNRGPAGAWDFPEYASALTGRPGGTRRLAWSAAASVLLNRTLAGERLYFETGSEP